MLWVEVHNEAFIESVGEYACDSFAQLVVRLGKVLPDCCPEKLHTGKHAQGRSHMQDHIRMNNINSNSKKGIDIPPLHQQK